LRKRSTHKEKQAAKRERCSHPTTSLTVKSPMPFSEVFTHKKYLMPYRFEFMLDAPEIVGRRGGDPELEGLFAAYEEQVDEFRRLLIGNFDQYLALSTNLGYAQTAMYSDGALHLWYATFATPTDSVNELNIIIDYIDAVVAYWNTPEQINPVSSIIIALQTPDGRDVHSASPLNNVYEAAFTPDGDCHMTKMGQA